MNRPCRIWLRRVSSVIDRSDLELLDEAELSVNQRFVTETLRARHAGAHALLRRALGESLGRRPADLRFEAGENDRPRLSGYSGELDFNLSHSGPYVACAVVESGRVGIDVETDNPRMDFREILGRVATPAERSWIESQTPAEARQAFYHLWVLKEAYAKARGDGLNLPFAEITLMPREKGELILDLAATGDCPDAWHFELFRVNSDAALAVAMHGEPASSTDWSIEVLEGGDLLA